MQRKGKFLYENGEPLQGNMIWVYHGEKVPCDLDEFGNFQIQYPYEWVDKILLDDTVVLRDRDVGNKQDFDVVQLDINPRTPRRYGKIAHKGGDPVSGEILKLRYHGDDWITKTDDDGRFEIEYPHAWVDQVLLQEKTVFEDWDVGGDEDLGSIEIERESESGKIRTIKLLYHDGAPVSEETVSWTYHDEQYYAETDTSGVLQIDYPHEWVDIMVVGGREVRRDWDLGGDSYFEDFALPNPAQEQADGYALGLSGMIFWSDGTALDKALEVIWANSAGYTSSSENTGGYCRSDGTFLVPLDERESPEALSEGRWYIGGHEPSFTKRMGSSRFFHVLPASAGGGGGTGGGLVTGFTVDRNGHPIDGVRVRGEVRSNAFLGGLSTPEDVEVRSDRRGRFALGFQGGGALKSIYLNGNAPSRVYIKNAEGEEQDISLASGVPAGSFSIYFVVPQLGFFSAITG